MREYLIHLLGGMTVEESMESDKNSYEIGVFSMLLRFEMFAKRNKDLPAEEWRSMAHIMEGNVRIAKVCMLSLGNFVGFDSRPFHYI